MTDAVRAEYARRLALVQLRLDELTEALRAHEAAPANWTRLDDVDRVEQGLARLVAELNP